MNGLVGFHVPFVGLPIGSSSGGCGCLTAVQILYLTTAGSSADRSLRPIVMEVADAYQGTRTAENGSTHADRHMGRSDEIDDREARRHEQHRVDHRHAARPRDHSDEVTSDRAPALRK
jgi:hypothetical protein